MVRLSPIFIALTLASLLALLLLTMFLFSNAVTAEQVQAGVGWCARDCLSAFGALFNDADAKAGVQWCRQCS